MTKVFLKFYISIMNRCKNYLTEHKKHPILQLLKKIIKDIIYNLLLNLTPSTEFFS